MRGSWEREVGSGKPRRVPPPPPPAPNRAPAWRVEEIERRCSRALGMLGEPERVPIGWRERIRRAWRARSVRVLTKGYRLDWGYPEGGYSVRITSAYRKPEEPKAVDGGKA